MAENHVPINEDTVEEVASEFTQTQRHSVIHSQS